MMMKRTVLVKKYSLKYVLENEGRFNKSYIEQRPFYEENGMVIVSEFWWRGIPEKVRREIKKQGIKVQPLVLFNKDHGKPGTEKTNSFFLIYMDFFEKLPLLKVNSTIHKRNHFVIFVTNHRIVAVSQTYWKERHDYTEMEIDHIITAIEKYDVSKFPSCSIHVILNMEDPLSEFIKVGLKPSYSSESCLVTNYRMLLYKRRKHITHLLVTM